VKFEAVGGVAVGNLSFEVCGKIDNAYGPERTFLWTNTTSNAETLRNERYLRFRGDFYAESATSYNWA
jgi:hypothetical protein